MIRNKEIWERYEKGEIKEQTHGLEQVIPKFGAELIDQVESDIKPFSPSLLEKIINAFEKKHVLEVHSNLEVLESAETSATIAENKGLEYLYGYIIPIIKAGHGLDSYIGAKTSSIAKKFCDSYASLQKSCTTADTKIYQQTCRSQSELLLSLESFAAKRNIEVDIDQKTVKYLGKYREWDSKCGAVDSKIDTLVEAYRSLELTEKDKKTLRMLRRPISKRFGLFKGRILKECSILKYVAGMEFCDALSHELEYVKDNLSKVYDKKRALGSRLDSIKKLSSEMKSYAIPLSTAQLHRLSDILVKDTDSTELIYFKETEKELKSLSDSNREIVLSILNKQKSYVLSVHDTLTKTLEKNVSDPKDIDNIINSIDLGRQELNEYLPQMKILDLNKTNTYKLVRNIDELRKKLVESKDAYTKQPKYVVINPSPPPEALVHSSIVDRLKLIDLPGDTRYWNIGGILRGSKGIDGWVNRLEHVNTELDKLKSQKNLGRTDYVLNVATLVEDSYMNGYLGEIASINPDAKNTIESSIKQLYSFGREVALVQ